MAKALQNMLGKAGGGGGAKMPRGAGAGLQLLGLAGAIGYGIYQSVYTGEAATTAPVHVHSRPSLDQPCPRPPAVDGGHRAIIFSRISGVQRTIYSEGIHFRCTHYLRYTYTRVHALTDALVLASVQSACTCTHTRTPAQHPVVPVPHHLRHPCTAQTADLPFGQQGPADGQHWSPCSLPTQPARAPGHVPAARPGLRRQGPTLNLQ